MAKEPCFFKQARRQEFPEGVRRLASRIAHLAVGGLGAAQGRQKPRGIWSKILQYSNFQALHRSKPSKSPVFQN